MTLTSDMLRDVARRADREYKETANQAKAAVRDALRTLAALMDRADAEQERAERDADLSLAEEM